MQICDFFTWEAMLDIRYNLLKAVITANYFLFLKQNQPNAFETTYLFSAIFGL